MRDASPGAHPATALLLAAARLAPGAEEIEAIRNAAREMRDWDAFLDLCRQHRVVPFVARQLAAHATGLVDPAVLARLRDASLEVSARALASAGELVWVLSALEGSGVRTLPYKGPALALAAYGDAGLRDCVDLDFVVSPRDVIRAREVFRSLGYRPRDGMTPAQEGAIYGGQGHFPLVRDERMAELHWRFCATRFPWNPPLDQILDRCSSVSLAGTRVLVPAREDHLLLLLLHGTRHLWEELEWLVAVAEVLRAGPVDGQAMLTRAAGVGGRRAALIGLAVARGVLGAPLPEALAREIGRDEEVEPLARLLVVRAFGTPAGAQTARARERGFYRRCLERRSDRWRFVVQSTLRPTPREWEVVHLPDALTALYVPIRLARLAARRRS